MINSLENTKPLGIMIDDRYNRYDRYKKIKIRTYGYEVYTNFRRLNKRKDGTECES